VGPGLLAPTTASKCPRASPKCVYAIGRLAFGRARISVFRGGRRRRSHNEICSDRRDLLVGSVPLIVASEAEAVVCARGFYRAGCIGPRGGVVVRRGLYPRRAVVVRRGFYGPRVYRRW
jgi:hypothetical protein